MKTDRPSSTLHPPDLSEADREVADLKKQFRREDEALRADGRGDEIIMRNRALLGIKPGARSRLVGFGGKLFDERG